MRIVTLDDSTPLAKPYGFYFSSSYSGDNSLFSFTLYGPEPKGFKAICSYSPLVTDAHHITLDSHEWVKSDSKYDTLGEYERFFCTFLSHDFGTPHSWSFVSKCQGWYFYQTDLIGFPLTVQEVDNEFEVRFLKASSTLPLGPLSIVLPQALSWAHGMGQEFYEQLRGLNLRPVAPAPQRSRFEIIED